MTAWRLNLADPKPPEPAGPGFPFGRVGLALLVLAGVLAATSCGSPPPRPAEIEPPKASAVDPDASDERLAVMAADDRVAHFRGLWEQAKSEADNARRAERDARLEGVRRVVTWACAIAALVGIVGAGVAVFLKSKSLAMIPVACAAMVGMGLTTNVILDHPWLTIGGLVAVIGTLAFVPALRARAAKLVA